MTQLLKPKQIKANKFNPKKERRICDDLLQKLIKLMFPDCLVCPGRCEVGHHFIRKSQSNYLRYQLTNIINLCNSCHCKHHITGDPMIVAKICEKMGVEWRTELEQLKGQRQKPNKAYYQEARERLETEIAKYA